MAPDANPGPCFVWRAVNSGQWSVVSGSDASELADVFGANLDCGEQAQEWRALRGSFDGGAAIGFFAFDDADDGGNDHAGFARGFDRVDGGSAGGADVIDNHDARAFAAEAFDAAAGAVRLLRFADEKAVERAERRDGSARAMRWPLPHWRRWDRRPW